MMSFVLSILVINLRLSNIEEDTNTGNMYVFSLN